jgi:ABC-2 type transport system permease protein
MIATIARKEFTEVVRDGRFRWAAGVVLVLLVAALLLGWQHFREVREQQAEAARLDREVWLSQGERNPHSAAHFGRYAFKPSPPLSFVDRGINSYTGVAIWMEAHYQNSARFRPVEEATTAGRFGELTAAIILQLLVPLLVILLAFALFAGEREAGTLRQLLSLGVRARDLAAGKALGVSAALLLLLVPATLIGAAALAFAAAPDGMSASVGRFLLLALSYLLYFGAFLGLSLAVSARARSARVALVALLAFWIVSSLVVPRVAADVSERLYPAPSRTEFWRDVQRDLREGIDGHNPADRRREELRQRLLAQYNVARVEDLPVNFSGIALQAGEEYGNQVFDRHYARLWGAYERQNRTHEALAVVSPLLAIRSVSMGVAGTDWAQHRRFAEAAETYRRDLQRQLNNDLAYNSRTGQTYLANASLWEQSPPFVYEPPGMGWIMRHHAWSFALLVLWFVVAAIPAYASVRRLKIS